MTEDEKLDFQYSIARQKSLGEISRAEALDKLEAAGMNRATAGFDLDNYLRFRGGVTSKRHSRIALSERYLHGILQDDGPSALAVALESLAGHIAYRVTSDYPEPGLKKLLDHFLAHVPDAPIRIKTATPARFKYGDQPTWKMVLDEALEFGRPVSRSEIEQRMVEKIPDFNVRNVDADLALLTVNWAGRARWPANKKPRRTDEGNQYDRLFFLPGDAPGSGLYVPYDPTMHGIWRLAEIDGKFRTELVEPGEEAELAEARAAAEANHLFDTTVDARKRAMAAIVQREGQNAFRQALLQAYGGACVVTGCSVKALLEAAHIVPYKGPHTNLVSNGLLLRADLHKLFDLYYFRIDPITRTVHLSPSLKGSEYAEFDGLPLRAPGQTHQVPLSEALLDHQKNCKWVTAEGD